MQCKNLEKEHGCLITLQQDPTLHFLLGISSTVEFVCFFLNSRVQSNSHYFIHIIYSYRILETVQQVWISTKGLDNHCVAEMHNRVAGPPRLCTPCNAVIKMCGTYFHFVCIIIIVVDIH